MKSEEQGPVILPGGRELFERIPSGSLTRYPSLVARHLLRPTLAGALFLLAVPIPSDARPWVCLPPLFEGGRRLHPPLGPRVVWLELLLRQHELCWRREPRQGEVRIALFGNSAIYGFPLPAGEAVSEWLNRHFAQRGISAHVFNLAFLFTYQIRDAVIIEEALRFEPDILLYPLTLAEFVHVAPVTGPDLIVDFFVSNRAVVYRLASDPPAGLAELLERYRRHLEESAPTSAALYRTREIGAFLRVAARQSAERLIERVLRRPPLPAQHRQRSRTDYDCSRTLATVAEQFVGWQQWNILDYVDRLQRAGRVEAVIVNWPVAHEPRGACYNNRYSKAVLQEYNEWMAEQTQTRGLRYVDLHDALEPEEFLDSLHLTAAGHRKVAALLIDALEPVVRAVAERRRLSSASH